MVKPAVTDMGPIGITVLYQAQHTGGAGFNGQFLGVAEGMDRPVGVEYGQRQKGRGIFYDGLLDILKCL